MEFVEYRRFFEYSIFGQILDIYSNTNLAFTLFGLTHNSGTKIKVINPILIYIVIYLHGYREISADHIELTWVLIYLSKHVPVH